MKLGSVFFLTILLMAAAALGADCPTPIAAGWDLWESGRDGDIFPPTFDFAVQAPPIPADFFGPGSDPFDGLINLTGDPFQTTPPGAFGLADAIVERPAPIAIPDPSSPPLTIAIELVALSLVSIQPITVTYNGGQNPELWDVKVCLSEGASSLGTMDISSDCCEGGPFQAELAIMPRFTFTQVAGTQESVFDFYWSGYPAVPWTYSGSWAVEVSPPDIPGPVQVDHDCYAATTDIVVGPSPRLLVTGGTGEPWFGDPCAGDCPDPIAAGHDLWEKDRDGDIFPPNFDFSVDAPPVPADFFGPGSDPFNGQINLTGEPLSGAFGLADAIVERPAPIAIPDPSSPPLTIAVELVALSLVSIQPITVTYNGGQDPELWDVKVCLSEVASSPGTMDISSDCCEGGTFQAGLDIMPRFTFTRVAGSQESTLDFGWEGHSAVPWTYDGKWIAEVSPPDIPGPVQVDHDCYAATPDIVVGPSPRWLVTGGTGTPWFGEPCAGDCPDPIAAGHDLWEKDRDGDIFPPNFDFAVHAPPVPADFFGPGSDPFDGQIDLTGDPFQTTPSGAFGLADAIVERPAPTAIPDPSSPPQTIAVELVALSLRSIAPITVTYNGGQDPELWDVKVCLSEVASSPGTMDISSDCCEGGPFEAELDIMPRFTFTRVSDAYESVLDFFWWGVGAVPWTYDGRWAVELSPPDIPGPVQVDHDCYAATTDIVVGPSPRLLVTGGTGDPWFGDPCSGCCVGRVGDANGVGGGEPTIGDISVMIDAKFITGSCVVDEGLPSEIRIINCLSEGDINQSGDLNPTCDDITIGDISYLIDYLFITGPILGLPDCL